MFAGRPFKQKSLLNRIPRFHLYLPNVQTDSKTQHTWIMRISEILISCFHENDELKLTPFFS